jgi:hypothetical protein
LNAFQMPDAPILVAYGTVALAAAQDYAAGRVTAGQALLVIGIIRMHSPRGWQVGCGQSKETFRWVSTHPLLKDAEAQVSDIIASMRQEQHRR